jgi:hypothetical protein
MTVESSSYWKRVFSWVRRPRRVSPPHPPASPVGSRGSWLLSPIAICSSKTDMSCRAQLAWNPGLSNGDESLRKVYGEMPRNSADGVPWEVRALENPRSPFALPGAVDLFAHDCIHALLGRGLLPQDEAFVLGFTMGSARGLRGWHVALFKHSARLLYRGPFRFSDLDADVFAFAVHAARQSGALSLADVDFRSVLDHPLRLVRARLGLKMDTLSAIYAEERRRWPDATASQRLPSR